VVSQVPTAPMGTAMIKKQYSSFPALGSSGWDSNTSQNLIFSGQGCRDPGWASTAGAVILTAR
jgi:hypothetical protein